MTRDLERTRSLTGAAAPVGAYPLPVTPDHFIDQRRPGLTACGLCAGETLEGVDHLLGGQRARLERLAARGEVELTFTECLDECDRGDVVVVTASPGAGPGTQARPVWFAQLAGDELTEHLGQWLAAGGPGIAPLPGPLLEHLIDRDTQPGEPPQEAVVDSAPLAGSRIDEDCRAGDRSTCGPAHHA